MKVILVDDEQPSIDELSYLLGKYPDIEIATAFTHPLKAVKYMEELHRHNYPFPDAVFLDIDMPHINGLEAALRIQSIYPAIIIVFVTAYDSYALDSFQAYPLDYILKPVREARFNNTVAHMRKQLQLQQASHESRENSLPRINCFGEFQFFLPAASGQIKWGTRRVKELFMYLLDRNGMPASRTDLIKHVFGGNDDRKTANNLYVTIYKLRHLLHSIDPEGKIMRLHDDYALEIVPGICDYTDFMNFARQNAVITSHNAPSAAAALNLCRGPYLEKIDSQWSAQTAGMVEIEYERIALGLAAVYISTGYYTEAEKVLLKLLSRNPLSEDAYTTLLDIYITNNKPQDFSNLYTEYSRILKKELGEKPAAKYIRHYKSIRRA